ncbi:MAG: 4-hydroxythreonine-4-phosphate dehydrogenase PdxA [Clostridia bacterium]|nr:4-hydroxythreonine-4-phosphate dehydrogenase PdxA [Clostridia bacterium]
MDRKSLPVIGIILGDHAGIGPEITAMTLAGRTLTDFIPVLVGNRDLFRRAMAVVPGCEEKLEIVDITGNPTVEKEPGKVYFYNISIEGDIPFGEVNAASGKLIMDSMLAMIGLQKHGEVDGFVLAPITKQALHAAGYPFSSEFEIFTDAYGTEGCRAVIRADRIFRCTVVGHVRFTEIVPHLTTQGILDTAHALADVMKRFIPGGELRIAVAALNPHAGEDGLFGDEESVIIQPAIDCLLREGLQVIGPCPADTVYRRAQTGQVDGIVFLYHDQGNIAMKAASFGEGVLIYTGIPAHVVSVGHGSAFEIAGQGTADPENISASLDTLLEILRKENGTGC